MIPGLISGASDLMWGESVSNDSVKKKNTYTCILDNNVTQFYYWFIFNLIQNNYKNFLEWTLCPCIY